jgi:hypothetical protein
MKRALIVTLIILVFFTACGNPPLIQVITNPPVNEQEPALIKDISEESVEDVSVNAEPELEPKPVPSLEPEPMPSLMPAPSLPSLGEDAAEKYLGKWTGYYNNNSGKMNLEIDIYMVDMTTNTSNVWARFIFSPDISNPTGKSGEYKLEGDLNVYTGEVSMQGTQWISANPENYSMLSLSGIITDTTFNGLLERGYLPEFYLNRF